MSDTATATVEVLTAEVRVLTVGQIRNDLRSRERAFRQAQHDALREIGALSLEDRRDFLRRQLADQFLDALRSALRDEMFLYRMRQGVEAARARQQSG